MTGYIGNAPTALPLASTDLADGIVTNSKLSTGSQQNFRNIIINGDMSQSQHGISASSVSTTGLNTVDRIKLAISSLGTWTQSQSTDVPTGQGFTSSFKMDCTTADASPSASDYLIIQQLIEGQNLQYLKKGTANAESLTLSLWVKSNKTGTYTAELFDTDNTRTINKSYTISSASTWEKKTITFDGDTTGAFNNDNLTSLEVNFWLGAGTTWSSGTLQTSWGSGVSGNRAVGNVNLADSTSNEWYITGVQLEAGSQASDFEFLPVDVNLQRCQRYFQTYTQPPLRGVINAANSLGRAAMVLPVPMRSAPTASSGALPVFDGSSISTVSSIGVSYNTIHKVEFDMTLATSVMVVGRAGIVYQGGSETLTLSAEL